MAEFRHFKNEDYDAVCEFLIELNRNSTDHIHWNWARFEWMYEHPEFDKSSIGSICLWTDSDRIVGAAIYAVLIVVSLVLSMTGVIDSSQYDMLIPFGEMALSCVRSVF